jgi:hypothetical protein
MAEASWSAQYIAEIAGKFLQEGLLGRAGITEDGGQPEGSQQVVGHGPDSGDRENQPLNAGMV